MPMKPPRNQDRATASAHRQYLHDVVKKTGIKPTPLAGEIGVSASTLTRVYGAGPDATATLRATTLAKLQTISGIPAPVDEAGYTPAPTASNGRQDAVRFTPDPEQVDLIAALQALIGRRRNTEIWRISSRALECAGFMPGDVVIVDMDARPRAGDPVCADVHNGQRGVGTVVRMFEPPYLVSSTFDPGLRKPLLVDEQSVIVRGVILPHRLQPQIA